MVVLGLTEIAHTENKTLRFAPYWPEIHVVCFLLLFTCFSSLYSTFSCSKYPDCSHTKLHCLFTPKYLVLGSTSALFEAMVCLLLELFFR